MLTLAGLNVEARQLEMAETLLLELVDLQRSLGPANSEEMG
jgi:hypothetical protein